MCIRDSTTSTAAALMSIGPNVTGVFGAAVENVVDMTEAKAGILAR